MTSGTTTAILVAPFRRRTREDAALLLAAKRWLVARLGVVPVFLPDVLAGVLDDESPNERAEALRMSREFVRSMARRPECMMVVAAERWSEGCAADVDEWRAAGREPVYFWQLVGDHEREQAGIRLLREPWRCVSCMWWGRPHGLPERALRCPECGAAVVPKREA